MTDSTIELVDPIVEEMERLFGPPPVLSSEDPARYYEIVRQLWEDLQPSSYILKLLIRDTANSIFREGRFGRYQAGVIEERYRQNLLADEHQRLKDPANKKEAESPDLLEKIRQRLERVGTDRDHVRALQQCLTVYQWLDAGRSTELKRRNDTLELYQLWRDSFAATPNSRQPQIIETEFQVMGQPEELTAAPSAPAEKEEEVPTSAPAEKEEEVLTSAAAETEGEA